MMTVLITGASSGIGAGLARSFAADGHRVIACGRDPSRLSALQQHSPHISVRSFDMTDRDACRQTLADCRADLIILCAGTCEYLEHGTVDAGLVERVITTNFLGPVNCLAALQSQLSAGNRVVLVSSMAHWLPFPRAEAYGASKAALEMFSRSLGAELSGSGVAVTVVYFPLVRTEMIAPTEKYDSRVTLSDTEAGEWIEHAVNERPMRIIPNLMKAAPIADVAIPSLMDRVSRVIS